MIEFLGSCKIQQNCTAGIKVTKRDDGKILAEICHTHHGHKNEVQHTWLSKGRRIEIAARLQQGVSRDRILNDIREDATKHSDLEFKRHHLVDKKDIGSIKTAFALNDIEKHSDDQTLLDLTILPDECEDNEAKKILNNTITAAKKLFIAVKEKRRQLPLKLVIRSPANKHIKPQRKFKSTKKRNRTHKVPFA